MIIQPTHHCFDDSLDYIESRVAKAPWLARQATLILVHGILIAPNGPHQGEPYAHAWVEEEDVCIEAGIIDGERFWYRVQRDEYYATRLVQETTRYTLKQAWIENRIAETYGPWKPEYKKLCGTRSIYGIVGAGAGAEAKS